MVPLLALAATNGNAAVHAQIGTGAILGAPLMLSTLSVFLMGASVLRRRGLGGRVRAERSGLLRDLHFFLAAFGIACLALFVPFEYRAVRAGLGFLLVAMYFLYMLLTLRASRSLVAEGHATAASRPMLLARIGLPVNLATIVFQVFAATALLVAGAKGFIGGVESAAQVLRISPLLLSLLIIPIATELPEKINSILWVRQGKDTLALGNITGAMVFQGTLLPAMGIVATPWEARTEVIYGLVITLLGAAWLRVMARAGGIPLWALLVNGGLYAGYLAISLGAGR
jgi:cation:H+ antiporter